MFHAAALGKSVRMAKLATLAFALLQAGVALGAYARGLEQSVI